MRSIIYICFILLFLTKLLSAQVVSGKVIDVKTGKPIRYANVFLEGSLIGSTTDKNGYFEFNSKGHNSLPVIVSFVGYETQKLSIDEVSDKSTITLVEKTVAIDEIRVKSGGSSMSRKKMLKIFREEFLGDTYNARSCKILNEDDIYLFYNDDTKSLHARSYAPLKIENKALGYEITYLLEAFKSEGNDVFFKGYSSFKELKEKGEAYQNKMYQNRLRAYRGSIMHFLRYLYEYDLSLKDTLASENVIFENIKVQQEKNASLDKNKHAPFKKAGSISYTVIAAGYGNKFEIFDILGFHLQVGDLVANKGDKRYFHSEKMVKIKYLGNLRTSFMIPKKTSVELFKNGYHNPEEIGWGGMMTIFRVGDLLPFDFKVSNLHL